MRVAGRTRALAVMGLLACIGCAKSSDTSDDDSSRAQRKKKKKRKRKASSSTATASADTRPLAERVIGEWELICYTDQPKVSACSGREDTVFRKRIDPDGSVVTSSVGGGSLRGRWELTGDRITFRFEGGGMKLVEPWKIRFADDRLVMWDEQRSVGEIRQRVGTAFAPAPTKSSGLFGVTETLDAIRYTLDVPRGYRLALDRNNVHRWDPESGTGLRFRVTVRPRPQSKDPGETAFRTPKCTTKRSGVLRSMATAPDRKKAESAGYIYCVAGTDSSIGCHVSHTRGYLEEADEKAGLRICGKLEFR